MAKLTTEEVRIAKALRQIRQAKGLSASEVARRAKFGQSIVDRTEEGSKSLRLGSLIRWLDALGMTPSEFFNHLDAQAKNSDEQESVYNAAHHDHYRLLTMILDMEEQAGNRRRIEALLQTLEDCCKAARTETKGKRPTGKGKSREVG
jgi:transcriptional regulator with XRE-family HTH domain